MAKEKAPERAPAVELPKVAKPLTTMDLPRRIQDSVRIDPPTGSLQTRELNRAPDPLAFLGRHALPSELAAFVGQVEKRRASKPAFVPMRCDRCGFVSQREYWKAKDGGSCVRCNFQGYRDGGHMKDMSAAEVKAHEKQEAALRSAQAERDRKGRLGRRNIERQKDGLDPLTMEQMLAEEKAEWERARAAGRLV